MPVNPWSSGQGSRSRRVEDLIGRFVEARRTTEIGGGAEAERGVFLEGGDTEEGAQIPGPLSSDEE